MTWRGMILLVGLIVGAGVALGRLFGPGEPAPKKPDALPASVTKTFNEDQANVITLSPEAIERLGVQTRPVERKPVKRTRIYGGEVTVPAGRTILVSTPLNGSLQAPKGGVPQPGRTVAKGQVIFELLPLLSPEGRVNLATARIDADSQVKTAQSQLTAAEIALDRAKRVFASDAGSKKAVDEAQALFDVAKKTHEAAVARRDLLQKVVGDIEKGTSAPLTIASPEPGLLRNVSAQPGQTVPAGAALFEIINLDKVWVRVPVYVGDLADLDTEADVLVADLTARPGAPTYIAKHITAPPSANPLAGTVDRFYALDNRQPRCSPGERVGVTMTRKGDAVSLTVPWSAVIHDIHGGTWVYEQTAERTYARRRVTVRYVTGSDAVLASGPAQGTLVVVAGAAELFGTETGFSK